MKLSYFMMPLHHPDKDYHRALTEDVEAVDLGAVVAFSSRTAMAKTK